jgi:hypothetical protein
MFASNQNIRLHLQYLRISKIYAPQLKCSHLIIYDSNKAAVEIFAPYEKCMRQENRRPNSYYLGLAESPSSDSFSVWLKSSRSGDVVSPPCSPQVGSAPRPPSLYGRRLCRTVPAVVPAQPAKIFAPCPNVRGREHFHLFPGKNQKPNSAHKCPITSVQIHT